MNRRETLLILAASGIFVSCNKSNQALHQAPEKPAEPHRQNGITSIAIPVKVSVKFGTQDPVLQDALLRPIIKEGGKLEWHYFLVNA